MTDNWKKIKSNVIDNVKDIFDKSTQPPCPDFENTIELFKNVLNHKTGVKMLDGLSDSVLDAIYDVYNKTPGKTNPAENLMNNIEAFLKKIIFIKTGVDITGDRDKNLMYCLKETGVLNNIAGNYPQLLENKLASYKGKPNFLEYVCKAYLSRNIFHNSPKLKPIEILQIVESGLVVYIYAVYANLNSLKNTVGVTVTIQAQTENYKKYALSVLSHNPSLKMLEADFGIKIDDFDDFEVKIKAKVKKRKEEREEYLKDGLQYNSVPIKFLPDIEGIMTNPKYILLHGIATSGKSTILKKLGKDFIEKFNNPYLFYLELGEIFKKKNGNDITQEILTKFKEIAHFDLELGKINDKILILLDGLDEVPVKEARDVIIDQVIALKKFNNVQIIITSRTNDYITNDVKIDDYFEKFELLPITASEIISLGQKILGSGSQFNTFVKVIKKNSLLKAFPKTPLTSILLAILFKEKDINIKELPKNITELYKKFTDLFLNRWDKTKGISEQHEVQKKEFVLRTIAEHMQKNRMVSIPRADLEKFILDLSKKKSIIGTEDTLGYITNVCERTNILVKDEFSDSYKFFHLTIQEYLAALKLDHKDDNLLVANFYDEWWLNPNIFYAGNKTDYPEILSRVSQFEIYPLDAESKFNFIAHSSQVLLASHNIDNDIRENVLRSMVKIFDEFSKELLKEIIITPAFIDKHNTVDKRMAKLKNQTLLDTILSLRDIFMEFFAMSDFKNELKKTWESLILNKTKIEMNDITLYCLSYCLAIKYNDAKYLEEFVLTDNMEINSRWYKIVDVDINIKKMKNSRKNISLKIKSVANKNKKYIQSQFKERISRHFESITGFEN